MPMGERRISLGDFRLRLDPQVQADIERIRCG
jgi:hypothetical protein